MTDDEFATVWETIHAECVDLSVSVVTGHTAARYADVSHPWVGAATAMGVGDHDEIVRPDGARPGDRLLPDERSRRRVGRPLEYALRRSVGPPGRCDRGRAGPPRGSLLGPRRSHRGRRWTGAGDARRHRRRPRRRAQRDGRRRRRSFVRGRPRGRPDAPPGVREVCDALAIDPWAATSCGSLLLAVDPAGVDTVRTALAARDTPVAEIGRVEATTAGDGERCSWTGTDSSTRTPIRRGQRTLHWRERRPSRAIPSLRCEDVSLRHVHGRGKGVPVSEYCSNAETDE